MLRARIASLILPLAAAAAMLAGPAGAQSLYWLDTNYGAPTLNRSNLDGLGVSTIALTAGSLPEGLAADGTGRVYWTEASWSNADVHRTVSDLSQTVSVVPGGSVLRGIAVDAVAGLLYWTSSNLSTGSRVMRSPWSGAGGATTLITLAAAANPRGIAVNRMLNKIYWADFDQDAIYFANLDGTAPLVLVPLAPGSAPYGVAVDPTTNRVYWTEYGTGTLRRAESGGGGVAVVVAGLSSPTYLAFDATFSRLYWTEGAGVQRIRRVNAGGGAPMTLPPPLATYGGIGIGSGSPLPVDETPLPSEFAIDRVWPTPGSGPLHVAFALPRDSRVKLTILDLQGRQVAVLADGTVSAGRHERAWHGRAGGGTAPAGVYFARLAVDGRNWVRRLVLTP